MYCPTRSIIATVAIAALLSSCSKRDPVIHVEKDDPEMNAAIAKGRETLPKFWQVFRDHPKGESDFALKVKITDEKGTEYFWAIDIAQRDGETLGTINNDPEIVKSVKLGDRIAIPEKDISDWMYMRDEKIVGNYTLRPLLKKMPKDEAERLKNMLAEP